MDEDHGARRYAKAVLRNPKYGFPFFEEEAYQFFKERLPEPRCAALNLAYGEFQERTRRWQWVRSALRDRYCR
jgi:hypothetical protein